MAADTEEEAATEAEVVKAPLEKKAEISEGVEAEPKEEEEKESQLRASNNNPQLNNQRPLNDHHRRNTY